MNILADPDDVCLNTPPFPDFSQSLGTAKERLKSSRSVLAYVFAAAVMIMPLILLSVTCCLFLLYPE